MAKTALNLTNDQLRLWAPVEALRASMAERRSGGRSVSSAAVGRDAAAAGPPSSTARQRTDGAAPSA
jgi:hypothetical protein